MKKLFTICIVLTLLLTLFACGTKKDNDAQDNNWMISEEDLSQVTEENAEGYINGELVDEDTVNDMIAEISESVAAVDGLPEGFPQSMPLYGGAEILEADTYGENGYTPHIYGVRAI